jgi:hypothetical protein
MPATLTPRSNILSSPITAGIDRSDQRSWKNQYNWKVPLYCVSNDEVFKQQYRNCATQGPDTRHASIG